MPTRHSLTLHLSAYAFCYRWPCWWLLLSLIKVCRFASGRVCVAIRENESRARCWAITYASKVTVLLISSFTASVAGVLHALYQPIISPTIADLGYTFSLADRPIGGIGTLSGSIVGAFVMKLPIISCAAIWATGSDQRHYLRHFVLFVPYGIVGTLRVRRLRTKKVETDLSWVLPKKAG